ncbi:alpha/beta hydrolase [Turicibacter sanguinis]|uniref:alpha/beta hydrolase n=1 Tax=Turicibacter sanguinis TaxID=154288 RepID=UPI0012BC1128|nr:alpha/beta hydrolase-fold protein [Turicibacter sanguinis]MDB8544621.1 alpha/beta hydrolase-fold protein [Turicibacter sanguinis]MTP72426.1 acetylesterase [Turicibacter sanguinis]
MSVLTVNFMSKCLNRNVTYKAIIPIESSLESDTVPPFKTLYLLHGMLGNCEDWITNTRIKKLATDHQLAVIMPSGDNSFYVDHQKRQDYYGRFIGEELINHSRAMFPLSKNRADTFIAGLSMGGYGAIRNGLKYHDTFSHIGGFSSGLILDEAINAPIEHETFFRTRDYFESIFGDLTQLSGSDCDYYALIKKLKTENLEIPKLYLSCGTEDYLLVNNREYRDFLTSENIEFTYIESKGEHDWCFWDEYIEKFLEWLPIHYK